MDWHCQIQQVWTVRRGLVGPHGRGYCRRLSDPRERPGPLKESLVTCSSLERACYATPRGGSGRSSAEAEGGSVRGSDRASLGAPTGKAPSVGCSVGLASLDHPVGLGLFGGLQVPGAWPKLVQGRGDAGWRATVRSAGWGHEQGALLTGPPPLRTGGLALGLQAPSSRAPEK